MAHNENGDASNLAVVRNKLEEAESNNRQLLRDTLSLMLKYHELKKQLTEEKKRTEKFELYGEMVERLAENFQKYIDDMVAGLRVPIDLKKAKPTTTTTTTTTALLATAVASTSAASVSDPNGAPIGVELTQHQTLVIQTNANAELVENGKTNGESSPSVQLAITDDSEIEQIARRILKNLATESAEPLAKWLVKLAKEKESKSAENGHGHSSTGMTLASSSSNLAATPRAHVNDQANGSSSDSTPTENHRPNGSSVAGGRKHMIATLSPSLSLSPSPAPALNKTADQSNSNASNGMSADDTASPHHMNHDQNGNDNDASMVQESPSALDTSSSSTKSVPSIFDTPKTTPVQKKKRNADRDISGDRDGDNDAKRMTRSKAKTGGDMADNGPHSKPRQANRNAVPVQPRRISNRRKTFRF